MHACIMHGTLHACALFAMCSFAVLAIGCVRVLMCFLKASVLCTYDVGMKYPYEHSVYQENHHQCFAARTNMHIMFMQKIHIHIYR